MRYTIPKQMNTARSIARAAEQQIRSRTGMQVILMLTPEYHPFRTPEQLLLVVARALRMDPANYRRKCRERTIVELRFIASRLLRTYFPSVTLQQIAVYFGGQDHSSVINGLERAEQLLASGDSGFTTKYQEAQRQVSLWLRNRPVGSVPAISA